MINHPAIGVSPLIGNPHMAMAIETVDLADSRMPSRNASEKHWKLLPVKRIS